MKQEVRKYKVSDLKLVQLAENLKNVAVRDLNDLDEYGVTSETLNELQRAIFSFKETPTDEELSTHIVVATQNRNSEKAIVMQQIRQISERARLKYGETDSRFRKYGVDFLNKQGTDELVRTGRRVERIAHEQLPELSTEGISKEMLDNLGSYNRHLDQLIDSQMDAVKYRDIAIDDRIMAGNSLYAMMITLAAKGKQCWLDLSERKYNDYISTENYINNWQCSDGSIGPYIVVNISATGVSDSTVFTLTNNSSVPLNFFFSQNPTDTTGANQVTISPGNSQSYTATALGYNEETKKTRLNVLNGNALPGNYMVEWL